MKKYFTKKNLILVIPGILFGILVNLVMSISRNYFGGNYLDGFNATFSNPGLLLKVLPISLYKNDIIALFVSAIAVIYFQYNMRNKRKNFKSGREHGSAKWGTPEDLSGFIDTENPSNNILLSQTEMISLSNVKDWHKNRNKNVLIVGGSGAGKTFSIIKPNIMQLHSSYVITDPKGTILNELGSLLVRAGYPIKVMNLIDLTKSMKYNPMKYIQGTSDILKLVDTLIANTKGESPSGGDFWEKTEQLLYQALIAGVHYDFPEFEQNLGSVSELLSLMEVREDEPDFKNPVDLWFERLENDLNEMDENAQLTPAQKKKYNGIKYAVIQYKYYKLAAGKTAKSILISCAARLAPINIPEVKEMLSGDELEIEKLGEKKTALFIIIPDTDRTFNFIASIMYTQLFNILCTIADTKHGGKLPVPVRCLLDEFANVGKIPNWEILIATIRSRQISATMILQTKSQLKAMYKDNAETIIGNCDSEVFLGGKEIGTLKEIAESLGKETIDDVNTSDSRGNSESKSVNYSKLGSELMSLNELAMMDRGKCVVQISGLPPFFSNKYDITKHPHYKYHASGKNDPNWFDYDKYRKQMNSQPVSMSSMIKKSPIVSTVKENIEPIEIFYEGDEVYADTGEIK